MSDITYMPAAERRALAQKPEDLGLLPPLCGHILVADDNLDSLNALVELLRLEGYTVHAAHDGIEALQLLQSEPLDAAILDISMPGLDGYGVAERIRTMRSMDSVRLIAVTGFDQVNDKPHAFCAGFDHYLTKPVSFEKLQQLLRTA